MAQAGQTRMDPERIMERARTAAEAAERSGDYDIPEEEELLALIEEKMEWLEEFAEKAERRTPGDRAWKNAETLMLQVELMAWKLYQREEEKGKEKEI